FVRDSEIDDAPSGSVHAGVARSKDIRTWAIGLFLFALGALVAFWIAKIDSSSQGLAPATHEGDAPIKSEAKRSASDGARPNPAQSTQPVHLDNLPSDPAEGKPSSPQPR